MNSRFLKHLLLLVPAVMLLGSLPARGGAEVRPSFLYKLSNFHGKIPYSEVRVRVDRSRDEVYVVDRGIVRIFNNSGMEIYWFGDNPELESIYDLAVDEAGDILLLSFDLTRPGDPKYYLVRCNYRGDVKEKKTVTGFPPELSGFFPNYMVYRDGRYFLLSSSKMRLVITDRDGVFQKSFDLADIVQVPKKDRPQTEIFGFNIDAEGNFLLTVPVLFKAFVVSPEGKLLGSFGKPGSAPGMFGVVSGIARDDAGDYLVVERLRSVVMVFDKNFQFLREFGYRGIKPGNLIRPNEVEVGNSGKLYVTQVRNQGVSVFTVAVN